jgi:hypothetical protein
MKRLSTRWMFIVTVSLCSCKHSIENILPNRWNVVKMDYPQSEKFLNAIPLIKNSQDYNAAIYSTYVLGDFMTLKNDMTFTSLSFGNFFFYGKWHINKKLNSIILKFQNSDKVDSIVLNIIKFSSTQLVIQKKVNAPVFLKQKWEKPSSDINAVTQELTYEINKNDVDDDKEDYTSLDNNNWRIKPKSYETPDEIKKRVRKSLEFAIMYLSANAEEDNIPLRPISLPIIIAYNGIQMKREKDVDYTWKENFYDDIDATTGYHILETAFRRDFDRPPSQELGVKLDLFYLKQLLGNIK